MSDECQTGDSFAEKMKALGRVYEKAMPVIYIECQYLVDVLRWKSEEINE